MHNKQDNYLGVGSYSNWEKTLSNGKRNGNVWGLGERRLSTWHFLNPGDIVFLYVNFPKSAVTGYGEVVDKFYDNSPFFADDFMETSQWPWRFRFNILWPAGDPFHGKGIGIDGLPWGVTLHGGFQRLGLLNSMEMFRRCQS